MSPYNYVANNPIIFIDPQGDTIKYTGNNKFNRRIRRKIWIMKVFGSKELRAKIKKIENSSKDVIIEEGEPGNDAGVISLWPIKTDNSGVVKGKNGSWIKSNEFSIIANELSHAEDYVSENEPSGETTIKWKTFEEKVPNREVKSNHVENMAREIFFWMPPRNDSHFGLFTRSKRATRLVRRALNNNQKNPKKAEKIRKRIRSSFIRYKVKSVMKQY